MSDPFANVCRKVTHHKYGFTDTVLDFDRMMSAQYAAEAAKKDEEHNAKVMEAFNRKENEKARMDGVNRIPFLENAQRVMMNKIAVDAPNYFMAEALADIYTRSLPHNTSYVLENYANFGKMAHMYVRKIGGFPALEAAAKKTRSPFLNEMARYISEASKKVLKDRMKKAANCLTEKQVQEMIQPKPSDQEREELIKKIDTLGVDQLAELVSHKVLKVVNDERLREKDNVEFKTILKNDLNDPSISVDADAAGTEDIEDKTEMPEDSEAAGSGEEEDKGKKKIEDDLNPKKKKKATKESFSLEQTLEAWDPMTMSFTYNPNKAKQTLFRSLLENITKSFIIESVDPNHKRKDASALAKNPLNLNIFFEFMEADKPKSEFPSQPAMEGTEAPEASQVDENVLPRIDKDRVYSEALAQYTLLECAHTMRLIDVNTVTVAEQANFLANEF